MKTPQGPYAAPPEPSSGDGLLVGIVRGWNRFWFTPASPLPLGFIRICTGLVLLYVHLIYSLDLMALVGPRAWVDDDTMTQMRKETPYSPMMTSWTQDPSEQILLSKGLRVWSVYFHVKDPA